MGKHEAGSAKAIAKAIKAKGLLKTRFYCQVCEKQCRDENGMKCHKLTEGHIRKMQLFRANAGRNIWEYSRSFEKGFVDILSRRHNTKRVLANVVYNEYIQDRHHVHLNSTQWTTLTAFVMYLGEKGTCVIDENERGWYVRWVDKSNAKLLARHGQASVDGKKAWANDSDEARRRRQEKQIRALKEAAREEVNEAPKDPDSCTLQGSKVLISSVRTKKNNRKRTCLEDFEDEVPEEQQITKTNENGFRSEDVKNHPHAIDTRSKKRQAHENVPNPKDEQKTFELVNNTWLVAGIIVKIIGRKVICEEKDPKSIKNSKGVVVNVIPSQSSSDKPLGVVRLLGADGIVVKAQHSQLETVLPDLGNKVLIVSTKNSFPHRGEVARLVDVDVNKFQAEVKFDSGDTRKFEYENICKIR